MSMVSSIMHFKIRREYTLFWVVLQSLSRTSPSALLDSEMALAVVSAMVQCWDVARRELILLRFEVLFDVVNHLPFNVSVGIVIVVVVSVINCCLIVNPHVRLVRMATRSH